MQELSKKIINNGHKWNPSLQELASRLHYAKKIAKYNGKREGTLKGEKTILQSVDLIEVIDDNEEFVKIYLTDLNALKEYAKLSSTAQQILSYIFFKINYNEDYFYKLDGEISKYTGLGYNVIYRGFKELVETKWVSKSDVKLKYWINVSLFFKGDRNKVLQNYINVIN